MISRGSAEDNAAQGLTSPVLLDNQGAGMRSSGVAGTPGAVLIDPDGKVASRVALGADAVLQLAGSNGAG